MRDKTITTFAGPRPAATLLLALGLLSAPAFAQDATKEPAKPSTQSGPSPKASSMADCPEGMSAKGDGMRPGAASQAGTDTRCADTKKKSDAAKTTNKPGGTGSQSGEMPTGASAARPGMGK